MARRLGVITIHLYEGVGAVAAGGTSISVRGQQYGGSRAVDFIEPHVKGYTVGYDGRIYIIHDREVKYAEVVDLDAHEQQQHFGPIHQDPPQRAPELPPVQLAPDPRARREIPVGGGDMLYDTVHGVFRRANPTPPVTEDAAAAAAYKPNGQRAHPRPEAAGPTATRSRAMPEFELPQGLAEAVVHSGLVEQAAEAPPPDWMQQQLAALQAENAALKARQAAPPKRGRGRPPKAA